MIDMGKTLDELHNQLTDAGDGPSVQVQTEPVIPNAAQIETLMLLRAIASPE